MQNDNVPAVFHLNQLIRTHDQFLKYIGQLS